MLFLGWTFYVNARVQTGSDCAARAIIWSCVEHFYLYSEYVFEYIALKVFEIVFEYKKTQVIKYFI